MANYAQDAQASIAKAVRALQEFDTNRRTPALDAYNPKSVWDRTLATKPWPAGFDQLLGTKRTT